MYIQNPKISTLPASVKRRKPSDAKDPTLFNPFSRMNLFNFLLCSIETVSLAIPLFASTTGAALALFVLVENRCSENPVFGPNKPPPHRAGKLRKASSGEAASRRLRLRLVLPKHQLILVQPPQCIRHDALQTIMIPSQLKETGPNKARTLGP